mmetsp:Transcript_32245/g.90314  ORF Transcript_32245/g.90314 Transcript_32245/m.90314 type:complete len:113 (+) Transcript_32245:116-454(+)|eukprot:CAMPEP_0119133010 /NCGR_PEP_ID=MMETSP1310-20130426/12786_1 /TAXON_ID=464262 /ORGANISM="Genus nov. species nov., Strain RCC2339" /LENGTH=112 /DNA_ID=CAMNT_0007123679 /DNA_START=67 /DNA_END=405 /DNA_ORIENTATION=-
MGQPQRVLALGLYKRLMRLSQTWDGNQKDRMYIAKTAREEFKKHRGLDDRMEIEELITKAYQRIDTQLHYRIAQEKQEYMPSFASPKDLENVDEKKDLLHQVDLRVNDSETY